MPLSRSNQNEFDHATRELRSSEPPRRASAGGQVEIWARRLRFALRRLSWSNLDDDYVWWTGDKMKPPRPDRVINLPQFCIFNYSGLRYRIKSLMSASTMGSAEPDPPKIPATNLSVWTQEELEKGNDFQRAKYDWDFSNERAHTESVFCQRVNFLLLIYPLFIAGAVAAAKPNLMFFILLAGTVMTAGLSFTIWRAFLRLEVNVIILHRLPRHPFEFIDAELKRRPRSLFPVNPILGKFIPAFGTLSLAVATVFALLAWMQLI